MLMILSTVNPEYFKDLEKVIRLRRFCFAIKYFTFAMYDEGFLFVLRNIFETIFPLKARHLHFFHVLFIVIYTVALDAFQCVV